MKNSCLGVFLVFLFIVFFTTTVFLFCFQVTFLNANFYKAELKKVDFYNRASDFLVDLIDIKNGPTTEVSQDNLMALEKAVKKSLSSANLQSQVDTSIDGIIDFLNLKTKTLKISLDLKEIEPAFKDAFYDELNASAPISRSQFEKYTWPEMQKETKDIFKDYSVQSKLSEPEGGIFSQQIKNIQHSMVVLKVIRYGSLFMSILLLGLIILIARNSLRAMLRYPGYGIAISGLLLFIFSLIIYPLEILVRSQINSFYENTKNSGSIFAELIDQIMRAQMGVVRWTSLVVLVVGLILIIVSYFVREQAKVSQPV